VAYTEQEAVAIAKELGFPVVVKAQIHAGGRGKGGGVKLAQGCGGVPVARQGHAGMTLSIIKPGPKGGSCTAWLVEEGMDSRAPARCTWPSSWTGPLEPRIHGVFAGRHGYRGSRRQGPEGDPARARGPKVGFQAFQARRLAFGLGLLPRRWARPSP